MARTLVEILKARDGVQIRKVRDLEESEEQQLIASAQLVERVASGVALRRLFQAADLATARLLEVEARDRSSPAEVGGLKAALDGLVAAHRLFADDPSIRGAAVLESSDSRDVAWARLESASSGDGLARDRAGRIVHLDGSDSALLATLIDAGVRGDELALVRALAEVSESVRDAARVLRAVQIDAPEGSPALIEFPETQPDAIEMTIQPRSLPIDRITEALRLTRTAVEAIDQGIDLPAEVQYSSSGTAEEQAEFEPLDGSSTDRVEKDSEPVPNDSSVATEPRVLAPIELEGLMRLAGTLNDDLAKVWSQGLDRAVVQEGIAAQLAAVQAALGGFQDFVSLSRREDEPPISAWPPPEAAALAAAAGHEGSGRAQDLAELFALTAVVSAIRAFQVPSRAQLRWSADEGEKFESYWDPGSFDVLSAELARLAAVIERRLLEPNDVGSKEPFRHLMAAGAALQRGDPESAVFHASVGFAAAGEDDQLPGSEDGSVWNAAHEASRELLQRSLAGGGQLVAATLIAPYAVDRLQQRILGDRPTPDGTFEDFVARARRDNPWDEVEHG